MKKNDDEKTAKPVQTASAGWFLAIIADLLAFVGDPRPTRCGRGLGEPSVELREVPCP